MKNLLLATIVVSGLAGPALAATYNTIAIDNSNGSVETLSIIQDDTTNDNTNTVSGNGSPSGTKLPIKGSWNSIAINQQGGGNTLQGSIASTNTSATASLTANYANTTGSAGNTHSLTIGAATPPANPTVIVNIENNGPTGVNKVTDAIDGASLNYNLGLLGSANTVTNTVSATTGGVTLTEGSSAYGIANDYGVQGDSNTISNSLTSGAGTVSTALMMNGSNNSLTNTVTTTGGNITLTQGGTGYGITGDSNSVINAIGQSVPVGSFSQTLLISGSNNTITNTVDSTGDKVVNQSLTATSSNNVVNTTVSGGGTQTANLTITNSSYVNYGLTSAASGSTADVSLTNMAGTSIAPAIVRVQQTASAPGASVTLSVDGGGQTLGTVGSIPAPYSTSGAGVVVYQNSTGTPTNASSGASVSVLQTTAGMPVTISVTAATPGYTVNVRQ